MSLSDIGSWASIISFPLSLLAIVQVARLRKIIRSKAIDGRVQETFKRLEVMPTTRQPTSAVRADLNLLLSDVERFYVSKVPFCDREIKEIIRRIKEALLGTPSPTTLKSEIELLRQLIFHTARV